MSDALWKALIFEQAVVYTPTQEITMQERCYFVLEDKSCLILNE